MNNLKIKLLFKIKFSFISLYINILHNCFHQDVSGSYRQWTMHDQRYNDQRVSRTKRRKIIVNYLKFNRAYFIIK